MMKNIIGSKILTICIFIIILGCGSGDGGGIGSLRISITDATACGFDQVNIAISKIRIHQSESANENTNGWSDITLSPPRKINLIALTNGILEELGQTPLSAGHYTQLRLVLLPNSQDQQLNNSVLPSGQTEKVSLETPSGIESGIKLIHEFDVEEGALVDLVFDFDACKSVVKQGNGEFLLKPVITVTPI